MISVKTEKDEYKARGFYDDKIHVRIYTKKGIVFMSRLTDYKMEDVIKDPVCKENITDDILEELVKDVFEKIEERNKLGEE